MAILEELEAKIRKLEAIILELGEDPEEKLGEYFEGSLEHEMVLIPAGEFMMGALPNDEDAHDREKPLHKVKITKSFYVGQFSVTQKLWKAVMDNNPSCRIGEDRPVENVTWDDCINFCNKLSEIEGREVAYTREWNSNHTVMEVFCNWNANGYRLLSEAEWEYAARANQNTKFAGSNDFDEVAWCEDNSYCDEEEVFRTHPVGQKKPNDFGLYDMSGNVSEWVWDWLKEYTEEEKVDPCCVESAAGSRPRHVCRSGFYQDPSRFHSVSSRSDWDAFMPNETIGFRLARTL